jgi:16S rRNA A1518/A1519 N6-dimethyltransferase RsmA/KsgA/DIM1 with predicted DNA glycosylase/AP lyase activity
MRMSPVGMENLLAGVGIDPQRRAETLDLTEWGKLSERYIAVARG